MKKYKQLTLEQRYEIQTHLAAGFKKRTIAALLGVHLSTIYREIHRNEDRRGAITVLSWRTERHSNATTRKKSIASLIKQCRRT